MKAVFLCSCFVLFFGCSGKSARSEDAIAFPVMRFDTELYDYLTKDKPLHDTLFLDVFGKNTLRIGTADSLGFYERLKSYFSDSTLMSMYKEEQTVFADITDMNCELSEGMERLLTAFPALKPPRIYMHVSGWNQNVVVSDDLLSLSADKYLGKDFPLYENFFYDYQRQQMSPDRMVPDYLLGFLMANFPFQGNEEVLLDNMLYEGKLRYLLSIFLPERKTFEYVAYSPEQYEWCVNNEKNVWTSVLENRHVFTPNHRITGQYMHPAPYSAPVSPDAPGRIGVYLGFRIVETYMKNHPQTSLEDLMQTVDYQKFLKESKYKGGL